MKKLMILPALLLIMGLLIVGCPSEPEPAPGRIGNPDITFDLTGNCWYFFIDKEAETLKPDPGVVTIEDGKEYVITLDVKYADWELEGCHFQGQLFYFVPKSGSADMNNLEDFDRYALSGVKNAQPQNIADYAKKYRLTFLAGDFSVADEDADPIADVAKEEGYNVPDAGKASTPAGAIQVLRLMVKTPRWYVFGKPWSQQKQNPDNAQDNWDVDYYAGEAEGAGLIAEISLTAKPDVVFVPTSLTVKANENFDSTGKGNIVAEEFEKLLEAPEGSLLRIYYSAALSRSPSGGNSARPGWNIGEFGPADTWSIRDQNIAVNIPIPREWDGKPVLDSIPSSGILYMDFYTDVLIEDILADSNVPQKRVFLNVYNGASIDRMVILEPIALGLPDSVLDLIAWYESIGGKEGLEKVKDLLDKLDEILALLEGGE